MSDHEQKRGPLTRSGFLKRFIVHSNISLFILEEVHLLTRFEFICSILIANFLTNFTLFFSTLLKIDVLVSDVSLLQMLFFSLGEDRVGRILLSLKA